MAKIINFHDIYDPKWFENTIEVISKNYKIVPFTEIQNFYKGKSKSKNIAHLTVDDGHISTYTIIYPLLKKLALTASIFVSPKIIKERTNFWYFESADYEPNQLKTCIAKILNIDTEKLADFYVRSVMKTLTLKQNREIIELYQKKYNIPPKESQYINESQLLELENSGVFCIGAHTLNHPILANESDGTSENEIKQSVKLLGEILGRKITTFAYPNGSKGLDYGEREINFLKEAEIEYAFSFEFRNIKKNDSMFEIPRFGLHHGNENFVKNKLKYGTIWEPFKKIILNNEDKHRSLITKKLHAIQLPEEN